MASRQATIDFIVDQLTDVQGVSYRKMFGEYALYCQGRVVALVCDDQLFVKPTQAGRAHIGQVHEAPPYPGAKNYFLIDENLDDADWLSQLIRLTADEVPLPKKKR